MHLRPLVLVSTLTLAFAAHAAGPDIEKVNGSITAEAGQTYGRLETVNGSIRIGDRATVEKAETVNGSIRVGDDARTGGLETVNGSIRTGEKVVVGGPLETVNGGIFVDRGGLVSGDIETVNGAIGLVRTTVEGDLSTVNGDVTIGIGSHVKGGLRYQKPNVNISWRPQRDPRVIIGPDARVDGPLVFERKVVLYVHRTARTGPVTGAQAIRFDGPTPPDTQND